MDEKKFQAIFKTGRNHTIQCSGCGVKSPPVREGEGVEKWCEDHVCGEDEKAVEPGSQGDKPDPEPTGDADPTTLTGEKGKEDIPSREELEKMTKAVIMEKFSPEWDGTKADLIDFLLDENQEDEEEEEEDGD